MRALLALSSLFLGGSLLLPAPAPAQRTATAGVEVSTFLDFEPGGDQEVLLDYSGDNFFDYGYGFGGAGSSFDPAESWLWVDGRLNYDAYDHDPSLLEAGGEASAFGRLALRNSALAPAVIPLSLDFIVSTFGVGPVSRTTMLFELFLNRPGMGTTLLARFDTEADEGTHHFDIELPGATSGAGPFVASLDYNLELTAHSAIVTPEPASLALLGTGLLGMGLVAYRRRRRQDDQGEE